eukprot:1496405-Prymnesium_polylepis.1
MGEMSQLDVEVKKHEAALPAGEDTADEADGDDDVTRPRLPPPSRPTRVPVPTLCPRTQSPGVR